MIVQIARIQWLQVEWRFLRTPDDEPGFSTAWQKKRSLERQANRREQEYQKAIMADFAKEFNVADILATAESVGGNGNAEGVQGIKEKTAEDAFDENSEQAEIRVQPSLAASLLQVGFFHTPR